MATKGENVNGDVGSNVRDETEEQASLVSFNESLEILDQKMKEDQMEFLGMSYDDMVAQSEMSLNRTIRKTTLRSLKVMDDIISEGNFGDVEIQMLRAMIKKIKKASNMLEY